jgi:hypothetical protein
LLVSPGFFLSLYQTEYYCGEGVDEEERDMVENLVELAEDLHEAARKFQNFIAWD